MHGGVRYQSGCAFEVADALIAAVFPIVPLFEPAGVAALMGLEKITRGTLRRRL